MSAVTLFSPNGDAVQYVPFAERIHAFFEAYPPSEYSVLTEYHQEPFKLNGADFVYIFKASLIDLTGRVVCTAHSRRPIIFFKDFESGETSARQRLLAALGFDGGVLDQDENLDFQAQNIKKSPETSQASLSNVAKASYAAPLLEETETLPLPIENPAPVTPVAPVAASSASSVAPSLRQFLTVLCKQRGIEVPHVNDNTEARQMIEKIKRGAA